MSLFSLRRVGFSGAPAELWTPARETLEISLWTGNAATIILSGSDLTQWSDTSGNNRNATIGNVARRPTVTQTGFNGMRGIQFSGTQQMVHPLNTTVSPGAKTIIAFYQTQASQTSYRGVFAIPTGANGSMLLARTGSGFVGSFSGADINSTVAYAANSYFIVAMEDNQLSTGTKTFRINGNAAGTHTANPTGAGGFIGGDVDQGQGTAMVMRGLWVFPGIGNTALIQRFEGWAFHDAGLASMLPAGHPFKSSPPTV
jgi:hypothetical protein